MDETSVRRSRSSLLALLVVATLALGGGLGLSQYLMRSGAAPLISGLYLPEARPLPDFRLSDTRGRDFGPERLLGRWSVLAYGYTHCPDICPTTLASLAKAARLLAEREPEAYAQSQFLFLSVDPARDTAARLAEYVPYFHPDILALRSAPGAPPEALYRALGLVAIVNPPGDPAKPEQYTVDHGVALYVFDPRGRLRALLRPEGAGAASGAYAPERLVEDLLAIQAQE